MPKIFVFPNVFPDGDLPVHDRYDLNPNKHHGDNLGGDGDDQRDNNVNLGQFDGTPSSGCGGGACGR